MCSPLLAHKHHTHTHTYCNMVLQSVKDKVWRHSVKKITIFFMYSRSRRCVCEMWVRCKHYASIINTQNEHWQRQCVRFWLEGDELEMEEGETETERERRTEVIYFFFIVFSFPFNRVLPLMWATESRRWAPLSMALDSIWRQNLCHSSFSGD